MIETLPDYLRERARVNDLQVVGGTLSRNFVLYWLRTVVRADENPALDVARWIADIQGVALLVYHAISDQYEYASDRGRSDSRGQT